MLLQILDYIKKEKIVSSQQIARQLNIDERALQPMLDCWLNKGLIAIDEKKNCSPNCHRCVTHQPAYYRYISS